MGAAVPAGENRGSALAWMAGRWLRRRWVDVLPMLVIVLAGTTGMLVAIEAARGTSVAFGRYLERANVGDVVLNPSVSSDEIDAVIRRLPGVVEVTSEALFQVTADEGAARERARVDEGGVESGAVSGLFGSHDGRYTQMDRPVVLEGRLPTGANEVALSANAGETEQWAIGDMVPLAFWQPFPEDLLSPEEAERLAREVVSPIGVEHATLVGLIAMPNEILPNEVYPRQRAIVSPDIARRYDCLPPAPDPSLTLDENLARSLPADCAVSYRYYSLSFADGAAGVKPALEDFVRQATPLNAEMAKIRDTSGLERDPPSYFLIAQETEPERHRVERATRPTVAALGVLGVAAGTVTLALVTLAMVRELRQAASTQRQWRELGMTRGERALVVLAPALAAIGAGVVGGVVAAWLLDVGPVGVVGLLDQDRARGLNAITLLAAVALLVGCWLAAVLLVYRSAGPSAAPAGSGAGWRGSRVLSTAFASPAVANGVRAAYGQRAAVPVVASGAVVSIALVAAFVFGGSLSALVDTPRSYGWPWDLAAMTGGGYGDLGLPAAREALDADPAVETWTAFGFLNELSVEGDPTMSVIDVGREAPRVDFPLLAGELPDSADEIALGATTAHEQGVGVGDTVQIGGPFEPIEARVSGLVVFPTIGPLFADAVGAGTGMLVPQALLDPVAPVEGASVGLATMVGVKLVDGASPADAARIKARLGGLDVYGNPPLIYERPVRPPEIIEARATRSVPVAVGVGLAAVGAFGLAVASWASVRSRRRDLAVLRALGFSPRQVRRSVRVQAVATTIGALVIGVPLGVITGRVLWRTFADQMGVVPDPAGSWALIGLVVAGAVALAALAAHVPARRAAATRPAEGLRAE